MNYEEKYKEALDRAKKEWLDNLDGAYKNYRERLEIIFPELKESENEKIKKEIIYFLSRNTFQFGEDIDKYKSWIAWLEKQGEQHSPIDINKMVDKFAHTEVNGYGIPSMIEVDAYHKGIEDTLKKQSEQKPVDKIEPKFKVGEWITNGDYTWKIVEVKLLDYILQSQDGNIVDDTISHVDEQFHLWTTQDAKDGDVLATFAGAFIYNGNNGGGSCPGSHCGINTLGRFQTCVEHHWTSKEVFPATKEQRDTLFAKMKEAGYEWDAEKKELRKTENKRPLLSDFFKAEYERGKADAQKLTDWSEDDKARIKQLLGWIDTLKNYIHYDALVSLELRRERIDKVSKLESWLKSLKRKIGQGLDPDKVIEYLRQNICTACYNEPDATLSQHVEKFKKDFKL